VDLSLVAWLLGRPSTNVPTVNLPPGDYNPAHHLLGGCTADRLYYVTLCRPTGLKIQRKFPLLEKI